MKKLAEIFPFASRAAIELPVAAVAEFSPSNKSAFRLVTMVVLDTTRGASPVAIVDTS